MSKVVTSYVLALAIVSMVNCSSSDDEFKLPATGSSKIYADNDTTTLGIYSKSMVKSPNLTPYFRDALEAELIELFNQKDTNGQYIYSKKNGDPYDIYTDELKIYTTLDLTLQRHAEAAIRKHLSTDLQPAFSENNEATKAYPFSDTYNGIQVDGSTIHRIMSRTQKGSDRYANMKSAGYTEHEIEVSFNLPVEMRVFSWSGDIDTVMTPNDSIRYYKNIIRSGLISIEPSTGFVKAWVGGINYEHFTFDHIKKGKQQIGRAIRPFTYAAAFSMGVAEPCMILDRKEPYCVEPCEPSGRRWCPPGTPGHTVKANFAIQSGGGTNISIMSLMGACSGPSIMAKLFERMNITIPEDHITPSICLGTPDMSLFELTAAYATFVNNGIHLAPQTIRRIEDKHGKVIYSSKKVSTEVYPEMIAYDVLQMMELSVQSGTSTSLKWHKQWGGITHPTAGQTGTTQGNADMWFFGMTPDLVTGIWTGSEDKHVRFRSMMWGQGARASLPIYGYYMQNVYADSTLNISTSGFEAPPSYDTSRFDCEP